MSDNNTNRLEIKPLIENYMDNLADGELAISQITGHVTIKNENEYISKTKELQTSLLDIKEWKDETIEEDETNKESFDNIRNRLSMLENDISTTETFINIIKDDLTLYETKISNLEEKLAEMDIFVENLLLTVQNHYFISMEESYLILANLIKEAEFLDVINETQSHFEKILDVPFSYYEEDEVVKNYGTVEKHEENKKLILDKVSFSEYSNAKSDFISKYRALANKYKLTGSFKFINEIRYSN